MEPSLPRPKGDFATRAVQGAIEVPAVHQRPVAPAIWPSTTWGTDRSADVADLLDDTTPGYVYGRYDTPTNTTLHGVVASLHDAEEAWSFSSGTAAIYASLAALREGGRVLATGELYGGTWALLRRLETEAGWEVDHAPLRTADELRAALDDRHTVVHVETIANPSTAVADIAGLAEVCRERGVALVVDNTFASPYLCRPVALGATLVVESATKHLGGHGDVVAGVVAGDADVVRRARDQAVELGGSLGPFDAWLVLRGIQTLKLRVREASENALALAEMLEADPRVDVARYPGLASHPYHELAQRQFDGLGFGSVLSIELPSRAAAEAFADACEVFIRAVSLGGTHSLVLHPASTTHRQLEPDALAAAGLGEGTVRIAVGIEGVEDLLADLRRGLTAVEGVVGTATSPAGGR